MKTLVVALVLSVAQIGFACVQQEAQFIGYVSKYQTTCSGQACASSFEIEFTMFNPSGVCPLVIGEVSGVRFEDKSRTLNDGMQVSGVLVKKDNLIEIE